MTKEEYREEAQDLASRLKEDSTVRINNDVEVLLLLTLAMEQKDPCILDLVKRKTEDWLEGDDYKDARFYLVEVLENCLEEQDDDDE